MDLYSDFTIYRDYQATYTPGEWWINDTNAKFCDTIELKNAGNQQGISCIPEGVYRYDKYPSPHLGCIVIMLNKADTAPREDVEVHYGNTILDIKGCCIVGRKGQLVVKGITYPAVVNSKTTLEKLLEMATDSGTITITSKGN